MSRRCTVQPPWLDAMLVAWGRHTVLEALGYAPVSPMFKERVAAPARSYEPTGFCGQDWRDLEAAIDRREEKHKLVILRAYKPWTAGEVEIILKSRYAVTERTWRNWLQEGASLIASELSHANERGFAEMDE
jgi:hypothetical protein